LSEVEDDFRGVLRPVRLQGLGMEGGMPKEGEVGKRNALRTSVGRGPENLKSMHTNRNVLPTPPTSAALPSHSRSATGAQSQYDQLRVEMIKVARARKLEEIQSQMGMRSQMGMGPVRSNHNFPASQSFSHPNLVSLEFGEASKFNANSYSGDTNTSAFDRWDRRKAWDNVNNGNQSEVFVRKFEGDNDSGGLTVEGVRGTSGANQNADANVILEVGQGGAAGEATAESNTVTRSGTTTTTATQSSLGAVQLSCRASKGTSANFKSLYGPYATIGEGPNILNAHVRGMSTVSKADRVGKNHNAVKSSKPSKQLTSKRSPKLSPKQLINSSTSINTTVTPGSGNSVLLKSPPPSPQTTSPHTRNRTTSSNSVSLNSVNLASARPYMTAAAAQPNVKRRDSPSDRQDKALGSPAEQATVTTASFSPVAAGSTTTTAGTASAPTTSAQLKLHSNLARFAAAANTPMGSHRDPAATGYRGNYNSTSGSGNPKGGNLNESNINADAAEEISTDAAVMAPTSMVWTKQRQGKSRNIDNHNNRVSAAIDRTVTSQGVIDAKSATATAESATPNASTTANNNSSSGTPPKTLRSKSPVQLSSPRSSAAVAAAVTVKPKMHPTINFGYSKLQPPRPALSENVGKLQYTNNNVNINNHGGNNSHNSSTNSVNSGNSARARSPSPDNNNSWGGIPGILSTNRGTYHPSATLDNPNNVRLNDNHHLNASAPRSGSPLRSGSPSRLGIPSNPEPFCQYPGYNGRSSSPGRDSYAAAGGHGVGGFSGPPGGAGGIGGGGFGGSSGFGSGGFGGGDGNNHNNNASRYYSATNARAANAKTVTKSNIVSLDTHNVNGARTVGGAVAHKISTTDSSSSPQANATMSTETSVKNMNSVSNTSINSANPNTSNSTNASINSTTATTTQVPASPSFVPGAGGLDTYEEVIRLVEDYAQIPMQPITIAQLRWSGSKTSSSGGTMSMTSRNQNGSSSPQNSGGHQNGSPQNGTSPHSPTQSPRFNSKVVTQSFLKRELCVRLAHRIMDFRFLPYFCTSEPHFMQTYTLYLESFRRLVSTPEHRLTRTLIAQLMGEHANVRTRILLNYLILIGTVKLKHSA
jgi:hypothetical protein